MKKHLLILASLVVFLVNAQAQSIFAPHVPYTVETTPASVFSVDFNGDGKMDLATANRSSNSVSVLLGSGTGTFASAVNYAVGTTPSSVFSADFNGDGKMDLATANSISNNVSVLLGSSTGTFATAVNYAVGSSPSSVFSADFNGDGKMDLVSSNTGPSNVSVLLGSGTGTFTTAVNYVVGTTPASVFSADFNGDGKMDLATANLSSDNVSVLLGSGTGTFASAVNYVVGTTPTSVFSADFNGDGKMDLVTANLSSSNVSVLLGSGTGTFAVAVNYNVGTDTRSVFSADFNSDGMLDLATANEASDNVSILLGSGTGTFATAVNYTVGLSPRSVFSADFNGDGKMDLATANLSSNNASILLNTTCIASLSVTAKTNVLCNSGSSGSATVTASGGAPYTYTWSPSGGNSASASGLSAGNYTCMVTNSCGAMASTTVTITQPASALTTATAITNILCNGNSTGSATLTASGGTSPYTYLWSTSASTPFITGQTAGVKTVTVTDVNGCKVTNSVTITQPTALTASVTNVINNLCFNGLNNATATITANGGTGAYTYLWSGGTNPTNQILIAAENGTYTCTVKDQNNCTATATTTITSPPAIIVTAISSTLACYGDNNGTAGVSVTGGVSPYTYTWTTGETTASITNQTAGNNLCEITDANGCVQFGYPFVESPIQILKNINPIFCQNDSVIINNKVYKQQGNFTDTLIAMNGCDSVLYISITVRATPQVQLTTVLNNTFVCLGNDNLILNSTDCISSLAWYNSTNTVSTQMATSAESIVDSTTYTNGYKSLIANQNFAYYINENTGTINALNLTTKATNTLYVGTSNQTLHNVAFNNDSNLYVVYYNSTTYQNELATYAITNNTFLQVAGIVLPNGISSTELFKYNQDSLYYINEVFIYCSGSPCGVVKKLHNINLVNQTVNYVTTLNDQETYFKSGKQLFFAQGGVNQNDLDAFKLDVAQTTNLLYNGFNLNVNDQMKGVARGNGNSNKLYFFTNAFSSNDTARVYSYDELGNQAALVTTFYPRSNTSMYASNNQLLFKGDNNGKSYLHLIKLSCLNTMSLAPTTAGSYYAMATADNGCSVKSNTIEVQQVVVSVNSGSICTGNSFAITPSGASTYTISGGLSVVTPTINTSYNVTGTSAQGCVSSNAAVSSVTVNALPVITTQPTSVTVCGDATATFTVFSPDAGTYAWGWAGSPTGYVAYNGAYGATGYTTTILTQPTLESGGWDGYYIKALVTGTNGCTAYSSAALITVNEVPTVTAVTNNTLLCTGQSAIITPSGAVNYNITGGTFTISPTATTNYTVTGVDSNGCTNETTITQDVSLCTGINNSKLTTNNLQLNLYPNPNNGIFNIELEVVNDATRIVILNPLGQIIYSLNYVTLKNTIDLSTLANGIYFLQIVQKDNVIATQKIMKQ